MANVDIFNSTSHDDCWICLDIAWSNYHLQINMINILSFTKHYLNIIQIHINIHLDNE